MPKKGDQVYLRSDGRWEARLKVATLENGKPYFKSFYGENREEALRKREEFISVSKIKLGNDATLRDITEVWIEEKKRTIKESSVASYCNIVNNFILPFFGEMYYWQASSKETDFEKWLKKKKKVSDNYCKEILGIYRTILKWFMSETIVDSKVKEKAKIDCFSVTEMEEIRDNLSIKSLEVAVLYYTGITLGELAAPKWSDFDLAKKVVVISRNAKRVQDLEATGDEPKTKLCVDRVPSRTVPINKNLMKLLRKVSLKERKGYVFGENQPADSRTVQTRVKSYLKAIGIEGTCTKIRDSFAITRIMLGCNPVNIATIMGIRPTTFFEKYEEHITESIKVADLGFVVGIVDFYMP